MKSIAFDEENGKQISARIQEFFKRYQLSEILRKSNAYKQQGIYALIVEFLADLPADVAKFLDLDGLRADFDAKTGCEV